METTAVSTAPSVPVIDADSHLTEPPDLWTGNLPRRWRDDAPHTLPDPETGITRWRLNGKWLAGVGSTSHAGWPEFAPSRPRTFEQIDPKCFDAAARARWMDDNGIAAQVLYPNLIAFEGHALMGLDDPELQLAIVRVYNDYQTDFARQAPGRFIPIAVLPFWDREASIREMQRCAEAGHRGVLWAATLAKHGLPGSTSEYWDPFYRAAEEAGMSINLHIGVGWTADEYESATTAGLTVHSRTGVTALSFMSNAKTITDLIMDGVCARFPDLKFVSVESGFGWIPFVLESLDWQWRNYNGPSLSSDLLPSEYFMRQMYGMFWFEQSSFDLLHRYADNVMFETDFPHTTSLSAGPGSASPGPRAVIERARRSLDAAVFAKVMYANAASVYRLDGYLPAGMS